MSTNTYRLTSLLPYRNPKLSAESSNELPNQPTTEEHFAEKMRNRRIWGREAMCILWADAVFAGEDRHESQWERVGGDGIGHTKLHAVAKRRSTKAHTTASGEGVTPGRKMSAGGSSAGRRQGSGAALAWLQHGDGGDKAMDEGAVQAEVGNTDASLRSTELNKEVGSETPTVTRRTCSGLRTRRKAEGHRI
jgi:hypothetical protein